MHDKAARASLAGVPGTPRPEAGGPPEASAESTSACDVPAWAVGAMLVWGAVVLAVYFRHAWTLLAGVEGRWIWPEIGQGLRYSGLPYAHEALVRAGTALGGAALCGVAFVGAGMMVGRILAPKTESPCERLVLAFAFGSGALGFAFYALAGAGLYTPPVVRAVVLVLAAAAVLLAPGAARLARIDTQRLVLVRDWPWLVIASGAVLYAIFCALAPETEYDALWYHLELPRRWLATGRPVDDVNEYVSLYPLGWGLLFGAGLSVGGPGAATLLHAMTLPACGAVAGLLARTITSRASAWMAAAIFVTAPTVFWEATTAYVDLALALHVGVAVLALVRAHDTGDRRWLIVAGLQLGFACATKNLGLVALASVVPVLAWSRLRVQPRRAAFASIVLVTVLALLVPLPWYVRAWRASGNPVFPDMYRVFGARPAERWDALTERGLQKFKDHFGRPRSLRHVLLLPWDVPIHGAQYGGTLGPLLLAGLPVVALVSVRRRTAAAMLAGTAIYGAIWASPVSSYQLRFLVPAWLPCAALLAAGTGLVLDRVRSPLARTAVHAALSLVLLACLPPWTIFHDGDRRGWDGWLTHVVREPPTAVVLGGMSAEAWLRARVRTYGAWRWIDVHAPEAARVLTFFGGDQLYSRRSRLWSEAVAARGATWAATGGHRDRVIEELRRLGITFILAPAEPWRTDEHRCLDLLRPEIMGPALERVYEDRFSVVYAVRAAGDAPAGTGTTDQSYGR
jgi:4-amino-4-deoxy-L-arabinose transferase-like glycosyltransferase